MSYLNDEKRIICSMCNRVCIKLVPLYDDDQKHEKQQCCVDCKRKIRKGLPIKKFKLNHEELAKIEVRK